MTLAAINRQRAQEALVRSREALVQENSKIAYIAEWEERTSKRIADRIQFDHSREVAEINRLKLEQRRERLKSLYEKENAEWKEQVLASLEESSDAKMEQIKEKALQLKAKREAERHEYVKNCYERQWRDACDDARKLDSKAKLDKIMVGRKMAVDSKALAVQKKRYESAKDNNHNYHDELDMDKKRNDDLRRKNDEVKRSLDLQVLAQREKNEKSKEQKKNEDAEQLRRWEAEAKKYKEKEARETKGAHDRGQEILKTNMVRFEEKKAADKSQRDKDLLLLKYALENERREIEAEDAKRCKEKEFARDFIKFTRDQTDQDKLDSSNVAAIRSSEMDAIWSKKKADIDAKEEARRQLIKEVNEGRLVQIESKKKRLEKEKKELHDWEIAKREELERRDREEEEKKAVEKAKTVETMEANKRLIQLKEEEKNRKIQEKYLLSKQNQFIEKRHQRNLAEQVGKADSYFPLRQTNWYS